MRVRATRLRVAGATAALCWASLWVTGHSAAAAPAAPACMPTASGRELLANPGFEGGSSARAGSWSDNTWGGAAAAYARDTASPHGGASAQRIHVASLQSGGVIFKQDVALRAGAVYQASVWLRSPDAATVDFELRRAGPNYEAGADQRVTIGPTWQRYTIRGGFSADTPAYFGIDFDTPGTVEADDAGLRRLSDTRCVASTAPIPSTYLGMHLNKWGTYTVWPAMLNFGTVRLWDTGTRWTDVEPQPGTWNWSRLDYYVNAAVTNHDAIIYTMGMTPQWASARPADAKNGAVAEPADMGAWRRYVHAVATRYRGRIRYWEIWNEADYAGFYDGSAQELVALTRAAEEELKAVDPANVVLSPDFTTGGLDAMSEFLADGGGRYIDAMSVHLYPRTTPEADRPFFVAVQDIMRHAGIAAKPLWNTEGAAGDVTSTGAVAAGLVARTYLLQWAWGVSNFDAYAWDIAIGGALSRPDHITPTAAGVAYEQVADWLRGSRMLSRTHTADGTWEIALRRPDGSLAHAVWNVNGTTTFTVPAGWGADAARDLSGRTSAIARGVVAIGIGPQLLTP